MKTIRTLGVTLIFLTAHMSFGGQAPVKSGVQTLPGTLPTAEKSSASLAWDFDLTKEKFYISMPSGSSSSIQPQGIFVFG